CAVSRSVVLGLRLDDHLGGLDDGAGDLAGLQAQLARRLAAHQGDDAEGAALHLDLCHHGVRHDVRHESHEAVACRGGGGSRQLRRHRELSGQPSDLDALEHLPAGGVGVRGQRTPLDPPPDRVLADPQEHRRLADPHLRHGGDYTAADASHGGQAASSTPPREIVATSTVDRAARARGRGPTWIRLRIFTPVPSANIAAASSPVCARVAGSSTAAGSGTRERSSTIERKPSTKSGTSGGRFPSAAPRRRCRRLSTAITGASISTRASLTMTASVSAAPPIAPPAATTWATSWIEAPAHSPAVSVSSCSTAA